MGGLVIEMRIFKMVQFMTMGSKISRSFSLPREIKMIAPFQVIKIGI
jgi:hypothetical protein